jgi:hypothetical protein
MHSANLMDLNLVAETEKHLVHLKDLWMASCLVLRKDEASKVDPLSVSVLVEASKAGPLSVSVWAEAPKVGPLSVSVLVEASLSAR